MITFKLWRGNHPARLLYPKDTKTTFKQSAVSWQFVGVHFLPISHLKISSSSRQKMASQVSLSAFTVCIWAHSAFSVLVHSSKLTYPRTPCLHILLGFSSGSQVGCQVTLSAHVALDLPPGSKIDRQVLFRTSRWRPQKVDKRMVLEYTHGLFIT